MRAVRLIRRLSCGSEVVIFLRLLLWAAYFRIMKRFVPLPTLVSRAVPTTKLHRLCVSPDRIAELRIAELGTLAARLIRAGGDANCLERSLTIYRQLIRFGGKPALVVGFKRDLRVLGHVWVVVNGEPLGERER